MSTAHLLLSLWRHDLTTRPLLTRRGVYEASLLQLLTSIYEEPESAVELAMERAHKLAASQNAPAQPAHLLFAITREPRAAAHRCLEHLGCHTSRLGEDVLASLGERSGAAIPPKPSSPRARRVSRDPSTVSARRRTHPAGPNSSRNAPQQHLLPLPEARASRGVAGVPTSTAEPGVRRSGARTSRPAAAVPKPPIRQAPSARSARARATTGTERRSELALDPDRYPMLASLGRNLTELAAEGQIDPVIGRDAEVEQLLDVLARRRSNNPILVGPPGVGKTAIVEGLALKLQRAEHGTTGLADVRVIELSPGALVAGSGVRGALAERLRALKGEVASTDGRVWVFLDEIHALIGPPAGPDDVANELKAALARGTLPCIGATTDAEYRRIFERDAALARRFTRIEIAEPSAESAIAILRGLSKSYEKHHKVQYETEALKAAVHLSVSYLTGRQLPDKAIGVMDQAAARVRRRGGTRVAVDSVAQVIAEQAKVPVKRLLMQDADRLMQLEQQLNKRVIGQEKVISRVAAALRRASVGFRGKRPLATFLFMGPTGVGKTELAKAISELVFPHGRMTRLDLNEFSEAHSVARLAGAPPGYVGHEDGGVLTEAVRMAPYQLVLLDEIEKAHPEVLMSLMSMLDEGHMLDARGRKVQFTHTIVVMTSNLGAGARPKTPRIGFGAESKSTQSHSETALASARAALPPELWNRIEEPLWFDALGRTEVAAIGRRLLEQAGDLARREHGVTLVIEPSALDALMQAGGFDPQLGARPMRRAVGRLVEAPLAARILQGEIQSGDRLKVSGDGAQLRLDVITRDAVAQVHAGVACSL